MGCTSTTAFISIHNMATWMVTEFGSTELVEAIAPGLLRASNSRATASLSRAQDQMPRRFAPKRSSMETTTLSTAARCLSREQERRITLSRCYALGGPGPKGISCVVIPSGTDGIQFGHNLHKMGWNSQPTREIVFDNVRVPIGHRLGEEGDGFKIAMKGLDGGRINIGPALLAQRKRHSTEPKAT